MCICTSRACLPIGFKLCLFITYLITARLNPFFDQTWSIQTRWIDRSSLWLFLMILISLQSVTQVSRDTRSSYSAHLNHRPCSEDPGTGLSPHTGTGAVILNVIFTTREFLWATAKRRQQRGKRSTWPGRCSACQHTPIAHTGCLI